MINPKLTLKAQVENPDYAASLRRQLAALGRRVGSGDIENLSQLTELVTFIEQVTRGTVSKLRADHGYSWFEIGRAVGITAQGAQQRWGQPQTARRKEEDAR